jgi:TonB family protein
MKKFTLPLWTVFAFVIVFLGLIAIILWLVLTPTVRPTLPRIPPVPKASIIVPAEPVRAIGEIKQPKLIKRVEPVYPEEARQAQVQGIVILEATTDIYGRVASIKVLRSIPPLDQAAIDAVRQWVYEPMIINGEPRGVIFTVTVTFELK